MTRGLVLDIQRQYLDVSLLQAMSDGILSVSSVARSKMAQRHHSVVMLIGMEFPQSILQMITQCNSILQR